MRPLAVMVVASDPDGRGALERTVRRLGHAPIAAEPAGAGLAPTCDVVLVDARGPRDDWDDLATLGRPMLIVVDGLEGMLAAPVLDDVVVVDASDRDAGFRVALGVCAALAAVAPAGTP